MKIVKVILFYKAGNEHHFTNYRPFSLLPQFSKILKKPFNTRVDNFIDKHQLLSDSQYGFRKNTSMSLALPELKFNRKHSQMIFLDLKKNI